MAFWSQGERPADLQATLVEQSWGLYRTNGPSYRFAVPLSTGHRVGGFASRLGVGFRVPAGLPPEHRERLVSFLRSLGMGEPTADAAVPTE